MEELEYWLNSKDLFVIRIIIVFFLSAILSYRAIPVIIKISKRKNLMAVPVDRSSHDTQIPNLGGIALFFSIGICVPIFAYELFETYKFLFPALVIIFYIGVLDDIVEVRAYKKMVAQVIIAVLMVIGSDVRIKNFFGLLGIYELPYLMSVFLSIFIFIIMVNAFNLIDGIDGLAGMFSVISCAIFGVSYYHLGEYNYPMVMLCVVIIGALLSFLYYNLSEDRRKKIFMGDTGSMTIGFLLVLTAFYFMDLFVYKDEIGKPHYHLLSAPVITFAILLLPIIDTLSVIIIRILNGKSPLKADKNHIHHKLLALGLNHKEATVCIISYYLFVIGIVYVLRHLEINLLFIVVLCLGFLGAYASNVVQKIRQKR